MAQFETSGISAAADRNRQSYLNVLHTRQGEDADAATDRMLKWEKNTLSKGRIKTMKLMSVLAGNSLPSRKKVFTTVQLECDYKLYTVTVHNKTISCAKVFNPALLDRHSKTWNKLANVQRFELEDPEGILTTIPKHFATNMEHLESFSITWTRVKSLPTELFREGLKTLSLERNQLKNLSSIEKAVDLSNLNVSSNELTELPKTFGQLMNLTNLNISGNAIKELPENFCCLNQLRLLDCSSNSLSILPDSICNLIELICLDVSNNQLTVLPNSIGNMPKLEDFRARANQLKSLPETIGRLTMLSSLILRKNKFVEVPIQLSKISSLQSLNMRENSIKSFSQVIPSLKSLILDSNRLEEINDEIMKCSNVQMLSLGNNKISVIPDDIKKMRNLRVLHLSGNDIKIVPEDIGQLQHLRHMSLSETQIETLPNAILTMKNLVKLDISDCPNMASYLKLAHKNGGLSELRDEMLKGISCENSSTSHEPLETKEEEVDIIHWKRRTVFCPTDFPTPDTEINGARDQCTRMSRETEAIQLDFPSVAENGKQDVKAGSTLPSSAYRNKSVPSEVRPMTKPKLGKTVMAEKIEMQEVTDQRVILAENTLKTDKRQSKA